MGFIKKNMAFRVAKSLAFFFIFSFLGACLKSEYLSTSSSDQTHSLFQSSNNYFQLKIPSQITKKIHRVDDSDAYLTYDNTSMYRKADDFSIIVYPPQSLPVLCPLTPRHMPELHVSKDRGIETTWGKVIYLPSDDPAPGENTVFCPAIAPATAAYAFCSQKGKKAVAICIQQVTDNSALVQSIFETFRWFD